MSNGSSHRGGSDTPTIPRDSARKRQHARIPINREFECIDEYIAEYVTDISHGGVFIRSKNPLPIGTRVTLKFSVILDDFETIQGEGEVVRVETRSGETGMGVAFTRLTAESKELIDEIVTRSRS
jgi:uncharacterized protein (TIGR02266 family)